MRTIQELGEAVALQRRKLGLQQGEVAMQAGVTQGLMSRFERGQLSEIGSRKLLAILTVLGLEMNFTKIGVSGSLDELRRERSGL
jgi:HTH-type transcriptional regulator / antitoxin HipB